MTINNPDQAADTYAREMNTGWPRRSLRNWHGGDYEEDEPEQAEEPLWIDQSEPKFTGELP